MQEHEMTRVRESIECDHLTSSKPNKRKNQSAAGAGGAVRRSSRFFNSQAMYYVQATRGEHDGYSKERRWRVCRSNNQSPYTHVHWHKWQNYTYGHAQVHECALSNLLRGIDGDGESGHMHEINERVHRDLLG